MMVKCAWCGKKFEGEPQHNSCNACIEMRTGKSTPIVDVPLKGTERYYKEGWFKKSDREWRQDIQNRHQGAGGKIERYNSRGERIG